MLRLRQVLINSDFPTHKPTTLSTETTTKKGSGAFGGIGGDLRPWVGRDLEGDPPCPVLFSRTSSPPRCEMEEGSALNIISSGPLGRGETRLLPLPRSPSPRFSPRGNRQTRGSPRPPRPVPSPTSPRPLWGNHGRAGGTSAGSAPLDARGRADTYPGEKPTLVTGAVPGRVSAPFTSLLQLVSAGPSFITVHLCRRQRYGLPGQSPAIHASRSKEEWASWCSPSLVPRQRQLRLKTKRFAAFSQ